MDYKSTRPPSSNNNSGNFNLQAYFSKLNLSETARREIVKVRESEPTRTVKSGRGVAGRFASRKMRCTIQFESQIEFCFVYRFEHDDNVLEYYDQPPSIKLNYQNEKGKNLGVIHTADYFVLYQDRAGWVEIKTESELLNHAAKNSARYRNDNGKWFCPPGQIYAQQFGLNYEVHSSAEINYRLQRNLEFLQDFFRNEKDTVPQEARSLVINCVRNRTPITLAELEKASDAISRDHIFNLIARSEIYVDLATESLYDVNGQALIFPNTAAAEAYKNLVSFRTPKLFATPSINLKTGICFEWDGNVWEVINAGTNKISVSSGEQFTDISLELFEKLFQENLIRVLEPNAFSSDETHAVVKEFLLGASEADLAEANKRLAIVLRCLNEQISANDLECSPRTLRRWLKKYHNAVKTHGNGYVGLIPKTNLGNATRKLPPESITLLHEVIKNYYLKQERRTAYSVFSIYLAECQEKNILNASFTTFCRELKQYSTYEKTRKRQGLKSAYRHQEFHYHLELTTPRHGERPFHIVHIDHTELDIEPVDSITGQALGRPWLTLMIDASTRRILAFYLSFESARYTRSMMVFRECVRRFGRMPQTVVVDNGSDFNSTYFETLLAYFECTKKMRPPAQARFGAVCERIFGVTNTMFINNLRGNTQNTKTLRELTRDTNPKLNAIWTLAKLNEKLTHYFYEQYDATTHPCLGQSPCEAFALGMKLAGERTHRLIQYSEEFKILTLPSTRKGTAKIEAGRGFKHNYIYYWNDLFRQPNVEGRTVDVRYDPHDIGYAYAFVNKRWVKCLSERFVEFQSRSEQEIAVACQELRERRQLHTKARFSTTAFKLGQFLKSAEAEEKLLLQRMRDRENKTVLRLINGETKLEDSGQIASITSSPLLATSTTEFHTLNAAQIKHSPESGETEETPFENWGTY